jgi:hypothetical protein
MAHREAITETAADTAKALNKEASLGRENLDAFPLVSAAQFNDARYPAAYLQGKAKGREKCKQDVRQERIVVLARRISVWLSNRSPRRTEIFLQD